MSQIISLKSENVKRLSAVHITPQGNVVVIGGKNGQGKSSVLDAIEWALAGDPSAKMPVRRGEEKSRTVIEIGEPGQPPELIVRRVFTAAGGTSLVVTNADGIKQMTPQTILDKLVGRLTFDPLEFARQKPPVQAETMRALVGLDFKAHDAAHDKLFEERTAINRHIKTLEAQLSGMPKYDNLPAAEVSASDILAEQQKAAETNAANKAIRDAVETAENAVQDCRDEQHHQESQAKTAQQEIDRWTASLNEAKGKIEACKKQLPNLETAVATAKKNASAAVDIPLDGFRERISKVEEDNRKIRSNVMRADSVKGLNGHRDKAEKMTESLEKMDSDKRRKTTEAKYPVEGLLFDASGGITLNGIPFEQCSAAEQLRVSVAVGFSLNPKLRVLLIRDGSLLDDESMALVAKMAEDAKAQIWLERVGMDTHTSVVIEDGHIQGVEPILSPQENEHAPLETVGEAAAEAAAAPVAASTPNPSKPSKLKRGQPEML